jgi:hypothetical protein
MTVVWECKADFCEPSANVRSDEELDSLHLGLDEDELEMFFFGCLRVGS